MRQKRAKAYKRVMALYVSAFNFRQPYQVLVSDTFLLEAGKQPEIDILKMVGTTVQGEVKPMITQCCIEALYAKGKEFQPVVNIAKLCERRKCNHREALDPKDCIRDVVGPTNKHRYVLALHNPTFASSLAAIPGLPIMHYNARGVLVLSPPSTASVRAKNAQEEERRVAGAKLLDGVVDGANVVGADARTASESLAAAEGRRKKPKAPNPLSVKKKKKGDDGGKRKRDGEEEDKEKQEEEAAEDAEDQGRRKKKRKRGRGKGAVAAAVAEIVANGELGAGAANSDAEAASGAESD